MDKNNEKETSNVLEMTDKDKLKAIEKAIVDLNEDTSYENVAYALTLLRKYMTTELIVAVRGGNGGLQLAPVKTSDDQKFFAMFTSFDEQLKGPTKVQSTYEVSLEKMFEFALNSEGIDGIIINPWDKSFRVNLQMIKIVLGRN